MFCCRCAVVLFACAQAVSVAQLRPETLNAWECRIQSAESHLRSEAAEQVLWIDKVPGRRERVRNGEIVASPTSGKAFRTIPHGLIHDWTGAVFIPGVSIPDVVVVLRDYSRYAEYYGPTVRSAQLLHRDDDRDSFRIRYLRKAFFVTVVIDIEYDVQYCRAGEHRWFSIARSTSVQQIQNYGQPGERILPVDAGSGYVWRAAGISEFEQKDGGVYLEQESIALSKPIPVAFRWMIEPFVERLSRELVVGSLRQTRGAVLSRARQ